MTGLRAIAERMRLVASRTRPGDDAGSVGERPSWCGSAKVVAVASIALAGVAIGSEEAQAACYYTGGGCGYGSLAALTPTPWTGNYTATRSWEQIQSGVTDGMTVQIRPYTGASGYSWSSSGPIIYMFAVSYPSQSVQHRCYHSGPFNQTVRCGFNDNP